jgi:hypothetical protein
METSEMEVEEAEVRLVVLRLFVDRDRKREEGGTRSWALFGRSGMIPAAFSGPGMDGPDWLMGLFSGGLGSSLVSGPWERGKVGNGRDFYQVWPNRAVIHISNHIFMG